MRSYDDGNPRQYSDSNSKLNGPGPVPMLAYNTPAWKNKIRPMRMLLHQHEVRISTRTVCFCLVLI